MDSEWIGTKINPNGFSKRNHRQILGGSEDSFMNLVREVMTLDVIAQMAVRLWPLCRLDASQSSLTLWSLCRDFNPLPSPRALCADLVCHLMSYKMRRGKIRMVRMLGRVSIAAAASCHLLPLSTTRAKGRQQGMNVMRTGKPAKSNLKL